MTNHAIYHITHVDNLVNIVREGRLWCDAQRIAQHMVSMNIGYSHIKARRMRHPVTVAAGSTLGNYVPFNFCPRSRRDGEKRRRRVGDCSRDPASSGAVTAY